LDLLFGDGFDSIEVIPRILMTSMLSKPSPKRRSKEMLSL